MYQINSSKGVHCHTSLKINNIRNTADVKSWMFSCSFGVDAVTLFGSTVLNANIPTWYSKKFPSKHSVVRGLKYNHFNKNLNQN